MTTRTGSRSRTYGIASLALASIALLLSAVPFAEAAGAQACQNPTKWEIRKPNGARISPQSKVFINDDGSTEILLNPVNRATPTANTFYVDVNSAPGGNGTSWAAAYDDISIALNAIEASGVLSATVRVASGTYDWGNNIDPGFKLNVIGNGPGSTIVDYPGGRAYNARIRNQDTYLEGLTFTGGPRNIDARYMAKLTLVNVALANSTGGDELNTVDVPDIVVANSSATGGNSDGFSYTMTNGQTANVLEAFVTASNNGSDGSPSSQGSTGHSTVNVVRVGGTYSNNPNNIADINFGTHWHVGTTTSNATANTGGEFRNIYMSGTVTGWFIGGSHGGGANQPAVIRANGNSQVRLVSILGTLADATVAGNTPVVDDSPLVVVECGTPPPATTCPTSMPLGDLGKGIAGRDKANGPGWIMWSQQDVHNRFNGLFNSAADHLVLVVWTMDGWMYDNNFVLQPFTPASNDCLVASVDYSANTATPLEGVSAVNNGIDSGYPTGDMTIVPQQWNGNFNNGEFQAFGTLLGTPPPNPQLTTCPATMTLPDLGRGMAGTDSANGQGYILWSQQDVHTRLNNPPIQNAAADHLLLVKWDGAQWTYDYNTGFEPFSLQNTDCLLAEVDYSADTVTVLQGVNAVTHGIDTGFSGGSLSVVPDQWNGNFNNGEFEAFGTQVTK